MNNKSNGVRVPRQERGIKTKQRITEAAIKLLSQKSLHEINTHEIAAEAGVSIGSFYSYFKDKKTLFIELLQERHNQLTEFVASKKTREAIDEMDVKNFLRLAIEDVLNARTFSPHFLRQAASMRYSDPEVEKFYHADEEIAFNNIVSLINLFKDRIQVKDIDAAAVLVHTVMKEMFQSLLIFKPKIEMDRIVNEFTDMIYKYFFK